jgi:hypothetical protein
LARCIEAEAKTRPLLLTPNKHPAMIAKWMGPGLNITRRTVIASRCINFKKTQVCITT